MDVDPKLSALAYPNALLGELDRLDAEASLSTFIHQGWASIEPAVPFVDGYPVDAICEHLEAVTAGQITRLLINVPPGCMKSLTSNVFWPAWEWGPKNMAHHRFIGASYDKDLSIRDNVRARDLMLSEWYQGHWGDRWGWKGDQNAKVRYENSKTGWRMASSTGAGLVGHRGDRIVLDDPHAVRDIESEAVREDTLRWFSETLPTRLNNLEESAIIVIMQRLHMRDVSGLILASELDYEHLCLPMEFERRHRCFTSVPREGVPTQKVTRFRADGEPIPRWLDEEELDLARRVDPETGNAEVDPTYVPEWKDLTPWDDRSEDGELLWPARFSEVSVEQLKAAFRSWGGTYAEAGQLQQRPAPRGGGMFHREDFQYVEAHEVPKGGRVVRGWDLAATKDGHGAYTVGLKMALIENRIFILDVIRFRGSPFEVEQALHAACFADGLNTQASIPQDPGQAGKAQKAALIKLLHGFDVHFSLETGEKADRARPFAAQCEARNVYLVRAPWNDALVNELCVFPNGEFLDQADAASRAYTRLTQGRAQMLGLAPRAIGGDDGYAIH